MNWRQRLDEYINASIQESLNLEYKRGLSLVGSRRKPVEIAREVSAMANSAGGTVVFGVKEFDDRPRRHLPEKLEGVSPTECSRETLEQIIVHNISPPLQFRIESVQIDQPTAGDVAYIVIHDESLPRIHVVRQAIITSGR